MTENIDDVDFDELQARVQRSIQCLKENDLYLFENNAGERVITHRLAVSLEQEFPDWHVDCEYDILPPDDQDVIYQKYANLMARRRNGRIVPLAEKEAVSVYPDIVVHHRGTAENLLVIEVKKSTDHEEIDFDRMKLEACRQDEHLQYRFALFVRFTAPQEDTEIVDAKLFHWV